MSRLIDAEKMIIKIPAELPEKQRIRILNIIRESIEQTPTVEAIPIEWLKRFKAGENQDSYWSWVTDKLIEMWREEQSND